MGKEIMKFEDFQEKYLEVYDKAMEKEDFDAALDALDKLKHEMVKHEMIEHETGLIVCTICGNKGFWAKG